VSIPYNISIGSNALGAHYPTLTALSTTFTSLCFQYLGNLVFAQANPNDMKRSHSGTLLVQGTGVNPPVETVLLTHWLFVRGQNSLVAVTVFDREVHYFPVRRYSGAKKCQRELRFLRSAGRRSAHFRMASSVGQRDWPHGVKQYSTFGGTCG
jgi:hypothetical protein